MRNKRIPIGLSIDGRITNVDVDEMTAAMIPPGAKRATYARWCVAQLYAALEGAEPPTADGANLITNLTQRFSCSNASVVERAIAFCYGLAKSK